MHGQFTCPDCGVRFLVPADATGAAIECAWCPWTGLCGEVEDLGDKAREIDMEFDYLFRKLAFTAPELWPARIEQLRERLMYTVASWEN